MIPQSSRNGLSLIGGACLVLAMLSVALYSLLFRQAPGQDFLVFYTAARCALTGNLPVIFDEHAFTATINAQFAGWLPHPLDLHPWVYPPPFLLLVLPFGLLPPTLCYAAFLGLTFLGLNLALRCHVPRGYQRWLCAVSLLASPAAAFTIAVGQNSFFTASLLVGGIGLLRRRPLLAGGLLGVLSAKPQLCLLVPIALAAGRQWRALVGAGAVAGLLAVASLAVFGVEIWREWLPLVFGSSTSFADFMGNAGRLNGQSAYTEAYLLGAPERVASLVQTVSTVLCAGLVWWCFRTSGLRRDLQLAILLTATILAAPHVANYDAIMATVAVSLYLCYLLENGLRLRECPIIIAMWGIELLDPPREFRLGLVTPLVFIGFIVSVVARRGAAARAPVPPDGMD